MNYEVRVAMETICKETGEVINQKVVESRKLKKPENILEFGFRHKEQMALLQKIQDYLLQEQSVYLCEDITHCPNCGRKLSKYGHNKSEFHAVFSDHKIETQCLICFRCKWRSVSTVKSLFGTSTHPDLSKLQAEIGASHSYRAGEKVLDELNARSRRVNNHIKLKRTISLIGDKLEQLNTAKENEAIILSEEVDPAKKLILQVDGAHIADNDPKKRSFEALTAVVYQPDNVVLVGEDKHQITQKHCVASAKFDRQKSIKALTLSAAKKEGLTKHTKIIAICDGAQNCWNVVDSLASQCKSITKILDWFHIGMRFQNARANLIEEEKEELEKIKWCLWHGKKKDALIRLKKMTTNLEGIKLKRKLKKLYDYLKENKDYLIHYQKRKLSGQLFTSQLAESIVDNVINYRYKNNKKATWSRDGAHKVLQIRTAIENKEWEKLWLEVIKGTLMRIA